MGFWGIILILGIIAIPLIILLTTLYLIVKLTKK